MEILHCNAQAAFLGGRRVSSGDRGPYRLHAHSTAHCGAASLAFIGPNHACRSHCEVLSPNNNTPVKTGVLWGSLYMEWGDDPDGYGQAPQWLSMFSRS